jgi:hypothetical protein
MVETYETCKIPAQYELMNRYENRDMVYHVLKEDSRFLKFISNFGGLDKWSYIINDGLIMKAPIGYFYFVGFKYVASTGQRTVRIGFVCWPRKIYATIDIIFNVYPRKSIYVDSHKAWCLPHSDVTLIVKLLYPPAAGTPDEETTKGFVRSCTMSLMSITRLCVNYNVTELREAYFRGLSSYPSYRLADILIYNQKLVSKVRAFMVLNCKCAFKTTANIPYCGCETLCSEIIPRNFADAGRMCSSDVLFCDA